MVRACRLWGSRCHPGLASLGSLRLDLKMPPVMGMARVRLERLGGRAWRSTYSPAAPSQVPAPPDQSPQWPPDPAHFCASGPVPTGVQPSRAQQELSYQEGPLTTTPATLSSPSTEHPAPTTTSALKTPGTLVAKSPSSFAKGRLWINQLPSLFLLPEVPNWLTRTQLTSPVTPTLS